MRILLYKNVYEGHIIVIIFEKLTMGKKRALQMSSAEGWIYCHQRQPMMRRRYFTRTVRNNRDI